MERPENEQRFLELKMIWQATERPAIPSRLQSEAIIAEAQSRSERGVRQLFARTVGEHRALPWAVAAALAALALGVAWDPFAVLDSAERGPAGFELVASSDGKTESLPDGSLVRLGPQSRIRFAVGDTEREVWLTGRAFFGVTHQPDLPFVVHTDRGTTRVHGTRFEVSEQDSELRVVVVEGLVRVDVPGGNRVDVAGGQIARVEDNGDLRVESVDNVFDYLDWEGGLLLFYETPMAQVAKEIALHFGVEVTIADPTLAGRSITARFSDEGLSEVVETVCLLISVECTSDGTQVTLGN